MRRRNEGVAVDTGPDQPHSEQQPQQPKRDAFEWTTLGTAIVGVIVVVVATTLTEIDQCSSSQQTATAVDKIAALAQSAHDQAKQLNAQFAQMKREADAANDQTAILQGDSKVFSSQFGQMKRQADAANKTARA